MGKDICNPYKEQKGYVQIIQKTREALIFYTNKIITQRLELTSHGKKY